MIICERIASIRSKGFSFVLLHDVLPEELDTENTLADL